MEEKKVQAPQVVENKVVAPPIEEKKAPV